MIKKNFLTTGFFLAIFLCNCYASAEENFQYWNTESVSWKASKDWKVSLGEEFRFGNNASTLYYQYSDLGVTYYGLAKWLDMGVNYRQIFNIKKNRWKYENRPHINSTVKFDLFGLNFSDRNRIEYRNKEDKSDSWRYRNKFTIKSPKFTKFEVQPYVANEIFYDFNIKALNRNRLCGGFSCKLSDFLKAEIYYLWESTEKSEKWNDIHVLGTKLKLSF